MGLLTCYFATSAPLAAPPHAPLLHARTPPHSHGSLLPGSLGCAPAFSYPAPLPSEPTDKSLEMMRKFSEQYAKNSGTFFCVDKSVTAVVIQGLAVHKDELGAPRRQ